MAFEFAREERYPTHYPDNKTPAHVDVVESGIILGFVILGLSLIAVLPAYGTTRRNLLFLQIIVTLFIGGVIVVASFGYSWEVGQVEMSSPYKPGSAEEMVGNIGIHISLRGINITLTGGPFHHDFSNATNNADEFPSEFEHEKIDYNENFSWEGTQGRIGFGYYAGQISRDFRAAVIRGVPIPILQLAEYFTFDGEGIRFGRYYRIAGWYCKFLMGCAFVSWVLTNILLSMVVRSGAMFMMLTGVFQLSAITVWTIHRNPIEIQVPFQSPSLELNSLRGDVFLRTHYSSDFYAVIFNGVFCTVMGTILFILDLFVPEEICSFFGIDPLTIYEEYHLTGEEIEKNNADQGRIVPDDMEMGDIVRRQKDPDDDNSPEFQSQTFVRKRTSNIGRLIQRSFIKHGNHRTGSSPGIKERMELLAREPLISKQPSASSYSATNKDYSNYDSTLDLNRTSNLPPPPSFLLR